MAGTKTSMIEVIDMNMTRDELLSMVAFLSNDESLKTAMQYIKRQRKMIRMAKFDYFGLCDVCDHEMTLNETESLRVEMPEDEIYVECHSSAHPTHGYGKCVSLIELEK